MRIVPKEWGHELILENNELYCLKVLVCEDRIWSSKGKYHFHRIKDETFLVIEGILEIDVEIKGGVFSSQYLKEGDHLRILPNTKHRFRSAGRRCKFIEASTPDSPDDSVRTEFKFTGHKKGVWVED